MGPLQLDGVELRPLQRIRSSPVHLRVSLATENGTHLSGLIFEGVPPVSSVLITSCIRGAQTAGLGYQSVRVPLAPEQRSEERLGFCMLLAGPSDKHVRNVKNGSLLASRLFWLMLALGLTSLRIIR